MQGHRLKKFAKRGNKKTWSKISLSNADTASIRTSLNHDHYKENLNNLNISAFTFNPVIASCAH